MGSHHLKEAIEAPFNCIVDRHVVIENIAAVKFFHQVALAQIRMILFLIATLLGTITGSIQILLEHAPELESEAVLPAVESLRVTPGKLSLDIRASLDDREQL